jgi:hypothetical protein
MARLMLFTFVASVLFTSTGCLTLFSKVDVVRSEELRKPIAFESPEAAEKFTSACKKCDPEISSTQFAVPFVTLYNRHKKLSESAQFNDAVSRCDTDQNGIITLCEAEIFARLKE